MMDCRTEKLSNGDPNPFLDIRVRKAMNHGLDIDSIITLPAGKRTREECISCGTCVDRCFFGALSLDEEQEKAVVDPDKCIGCGVCTMTRPEETLKLHRCERPEAPFNNNAEFFITIASDNERL